MGRTTSTALPLYLVEYYTPKNTFLIRLEAPPLLSQPEVKSLPSFAAQVSLTKEEIISLCPFHHARAHIYEVPQLKSLLKTRVGGHLRASTFFHGVTTSHKLKSQPPLS